MRSIWRSTDRRHRLQGLYNTAIERIVAPLERPTLLEKNYQVGYNVDKDRASLTKVKNIHETGQIISYRPEKHRFRLENLRPETWYL